MVTWEQVEIEFGKELSERMKKSKYLQGITMTMNDDGTTDIPESDIACAYKDITGMEIAWWEYD